MKKTSEKIQSFFRKKFVSDVSWNIGSTAILGVAGIFLNVLIGRLYGAKALGVFSQSMAVYLLLAMVGAFGINTSVLKHGAEYREERETLDALLSSALLLALTLSVSLSVLAWFAAPVIAQVLNSQALAQHIRILIWGLPFFVMNKILMAVLNAFREMKRYAIFQSSRWLIILVLGIIVSFSALPYGTLFYIFPLVEISILLPLIMFITKTLGFRWSKPDAWLKHHFHFGKQSFFAGALAEMNARTDILMIGFFLSDAMVGIYSLASSVARGILTFSSIIQLNFNPIITRLWTENRIHELQAQLFRLRKYIILAYVPIIAVALGAYPLFLEFFFKQGEWRESLSVFHLLLVGIALYSPFMYCSGILIQAGRPGVHLRISFFSLLGNILLNVCLIPILGIRGAATATSLSYCLTIFLLEVQTRKHLGFSLFIHRRSG